jgi:hypothetical protein
MASAQRTVTSTSETITTVRYEHYSNNGSVSTSKYSASNSQEAVNNHETVKAAYVPRRGAPEASQKESRKKPGSPDFTCTAIVYDSSNLLGLTVKKDVSVRAPGKRELLIKVFAASINPVDYKLNTVPVVGLFQDGKIVGHDFCGQVVKIGYKVQNFKVGDDVYGFAHGSLSQYCIADESKVAIKPAKVQPHSSSTLPLLTPVAQSTPALRLLPPRPIQPSTHDQ